MRTPLRKRVARVLVGSLYERIEELEGAVQENRNLNLQVAELIDLVQELLIPIASQDEDKIDAAIAKFQESL
jgi:hypothetical protein